MIFKKYQRDLIRKYGPRLEGSVLDIGCGKKPYKKFLTKASKYVGMDTDKNVEPDLVGAIEDIKAKDGSFGGVLCSEVIEHVPEPLEALKEVARVTERGGLLYLTVPMSWGLHYEPHDYYRFTPYSLKYLLKKSGFKIEKTERIGGFCSLVSQRIIDVSYFFMLRLKIPRLVVIILLAPISILSYYSALIFDRIDKRDALGWMVLARKK